MGTTLLGEILRDWRGYELEDSIYLPAGKVAALDLIVRVLPFDPTMGRLFEQHEYWLGIEQVRDVVEGLEAQLGRTATPSERLRAVDHYAHYDAFMDAASVISGDSSAAGRSPVS